ncbi:aldolase [Bordetella pertussis]|nr:aldolase [Bordetella pertussis]
MNSPLPNRFRQRILAREQLIGYWLSLASHITAEVAGMADFDWLLLDAEHSPNDVPLLLQQLQALQGSASAAVGRPSWNDPVEIKRMLDIGFYNLLIPFIDSADDARRAVAAMRYPPQGMRGVSVAQRSNRYGTVTDYLRTINDNICVLLQIESRPGVEAVDEIAAVDGVDGVFIGPSDLAAALGHLGNPGHPEVQEAIRHLHGRVAAQGKAVGILAPVQADARRYLDMGRTSWRSVRTWASSSRPRSPCARHFRPEAGGGRARRAPKQACAKTKRMPAGILSACRIRCPEGQYWL